jgi:HK97 gp10 family phage protein
VPLSIKVTVLANDFPRYASGVRAAMAAHTRATAEMVATGAKERAPVDTGNLRASIHAQSTGEASAVVGPGVQAPYSIFVHEGTRRMSPRPFLRQAAEAVRPYWDAGIKRILRGGK